MTKERKVQTALAKGYGGSMVEMTPRDELFCRTLMTRSGMGQSGELAGKIYGVKNGEAKAAMLLKDGKIRARLREFLECAGFNEFEVDRELLEIVRQSADLSAKLGAIREFNKIMGRTDGEMGKTTVNNNIVVIRSQ